MSKSLRQLITLFVVPLMFFVNGPVIDTVSAASGTEIIHDGIAEAVSGNRIQVLATVTDSEGVDVVRTYFKSAEGKNYNFVAMEDIGDNQYAGTLPAPAANAGSVDYLILVKNSANVVVKSQTFTANVVEGNGDGTTTGEPVQVYSELAEAPTEIAGFSDSITTDVVVSAAKFGVVAGVVSQAAAGGTAAGAGAVSAGTTTATTTTATATTASAGSATATSTAAASGGMSTLGVVAAGAAVVAGGAYAVSAASDAVEEYTSSTSTITCNYVGSDQCIDFTYTGSSYSSCSSYSSGYSSGTCNTSGATAKCDYSYTSYSDWNHYYFSPTFTTSNMNAYGSSLCSGTLTVY
ncbi:MAG: hypothetical protein HQL69_06060 [Magnetococcales bacterium]|nr:hypothetical protein [Magnetococcales bacterium]